jgi:hypothetical protein
MSAEPVLVSRVPGPRRREVGWWSYVAATFAVALGVAARHWVADPATRPWAVGMTLLLGGILTSHVAQRTWLDQARGRLLHRRAWVVRWEVAWAEARVVRLRHDHKGLVLLQVCGRHRLLGLHVPVAGDDARGPRGQPPAVLRRLADEIRGRAPAVHHEVADELAAQADHLERGGSLLDSPILLAHRGPRIFP